MNLIEIAKNMSDKKAAQQQIKEKPISGRGKVYKSIKDALQRGYHGEIFSTPGSKRQYVITKPKWGKKSKLGPQDKTARGFNPGDSVPSGDTEKKQTFLQKAKKVRFGKSDR